ncbi:hypothetical protein ACFQZQ_12690 [Lysobacter koreensis]|uniref:DUF350 domain-containing protein n=1 Tax=Lysobacter koreensis TaxID=266122 RepID=A0ABW2YP60_9GAMM
MCNPSKIAALLISASVFLLLAVVLAATATALAGSWWTSSANMPIMIVIAVLSGTAMGSVNAAAAEAAQCTVAPCKEAGDKLFAALIGLVAALGALTAAAVAGALIATIPYAGIAVAVAIGVSAAAAGITLVVVSSVLLPQLDDCRARSAAGTPSGLVAFQKTLGIFAGVALALTGGIVTFA